MINRAYLSYLPEYMGRIREIKALAAVIDSFLTAAERQNDLIVREGMIKTAEGIGLSRWEELLDIASEGSVGERRARITACLSGSAPYTQRTVKAALEAVLGEDSVRLEYGTAPYTLIVTVLPSLENAEEMIRTVLKRLLPANISFSIVFDYNRHADLAGHTHGQLAAYTHSQLRTEEI